MNHMDEGTIAEFLDRGLAQPNDRRMIEQHLAGCAECRTRVDEARQMRVRAQAILRQSGPADVEPPPFAQIEARAGHRPRRAWWASRPLTLAATAVLAVGISWAAGEFVTRTPASSAPARAAEAAAPPKGVPLVDEAAAAGSAMAQRTPTAEPAATPAAELPMIESPPDVAPLAARDVGGVASGAAGARTERMAAAPLPAAAPAAAQRIDAAADRAEEYARRLELGRAVAAEQAAVTTGEYLGWTLMTRADAERVLGGPVYVIDGLRIIDHAMRHVAPVAVRTRLALDGDGVIALVQSPSADDAAPRAGQLAAPTRRVHVDVGGFRVTASGPISDDSLRVLLRRLRR